MFHVGIGNTGSVNGFSVMIMQSQQDTDRVIKELENAARAGYNPHMVFSQVLDECRVREKDLTDFDKQRLKRKIDEISKHQSLGRFY